MASGTGSKQCAEITILGVPCGSGGGHPGTAHGPSAARAAGLAEHLEHEGVTFEDRGDLTIEVPQAGGRIGIVGAWCTAIRQETRAIAAAGRMPLTLGGDHSIAAGSMSGTCAAYRAQHDQAPGLLWVDAHVDLNTHATSPSGNPHGMPAAALMGWSVEMFSKIVGPDGIFDTNRVALVGARDIDPGEQKHIDDGNIALWSTQDIKDRGVEEVMNAALEVVAPDGAPFCMSFDIDVVDPKFAPGVDTAVPNGLTPAETIECVARAGRHAPILALDLVELNPERDVDGQTARLAVECISAAIQAMNAASH